MADIRAAVIGAGSMGRHHARILSRMPGVSFVGVVDPAISAGHPHAAGSPVFASLDQLPDVDFAVVATPTEHHLSAALTLIERGSSLLVEKPLAATPEEADALVEAAERAGVLLSVGHVERFNPAVLALKRMIRDPRLAQFQRLSPYTPRISDSVVFDLMVHDLDLACWILGGYPVRVQASGAAVFSDSLDIAGALLEFEDGRIASLQASRATQDKVRRISVSEPERYLLADSVRQDVSVKRQTEVEFADEETPVYRQASVVEIPYLDRSEPLVAELEDVLAALREDREPIVTGRDGAAAVRLAREVERIAGA